jgi:hypothetical protein
MATRALGSLGPGWKMVTRGQVVGGVTSPHPACWLSACRVWIHKSDEHTGTDESRVLSSRTSRKVKTRDSKKTTSSTDVLVDRPDQLRTRSSACRSNSRDISRRRDVGYRLPVIRTVMTKLVTNTRTNFESASPSDELASRCIIETLAVAYHLRARVLCNRAVLEYRNADRFQLPGEEQWLGSLSAIAAPTA